ncbi:hypothetical protein N7G274_010596 [Stereocaulon virgatum]|uniref:Peptidase M43 pregnancy-associated plasma-A domain-containing protein n=1 Tax=Stereocaulon virgatum TaxID=373712 RepID=A0ABR3ZVA2_9LECA
MLLRALFILSSATTPTFALPVGTTNQNATLGSTVHIINIPDISSQACNTKQPSQELKNTHKALRDNPHLHPRTTQQIQVNVYSHFVTTFDQAYHYPPNVRKNLIGKQIDALNAAYQSANIAFAPKTTSYTVRDDWATDANSTNMKNSLRQGGYADLNIYFQTNLSSAPYRYSPASTLLGYCTLPTNMTYPNGHGGLTEFPPYDYATDGCNVLAASMPQSPVKVYGYDLGKTAVHEVGHWFGLLHTFQDNTCDPSDPGDFMNDTPQESISTSGCPTGKNSCPNRAGYDPINNYMDYSTDECYTQFTPDQQARMISMYNLYRQNE